MLIHNSMQLFQILFDICADKNLTMKRDCCLTEYQLVSFLVNTMLQNKLYKIQIAQKSKFRCEVQMIVTKLVIS